MCVGALIHARISDGGVRRHRAEGRRVVSMTRAHELAGLNHRLEALGGVLEDECRAVIQEFFKPQGYA